MSEIERQPKDEEFVNYLPAMPSLSAEPGPIRRLLGRVLRRSGD